MTSPYLGSLCLRGHEYQETGKSLRYTSNWDCVECSRGREDPAKRRERVRLWGRGKTRTQDIDNKRASARKYQKSHPLRSILSQQTRRARKQANGVYRIRDQDIGELFEWFGGKCAWCSEREATELDHVVSIKRGGVHGLQNLLPACGRCNRSKGDREPWVWFESRPFYSSQW